MSTEIDLNGFFKLAGAGGRGWHSDSNEFERQHEEARRRSVLLVDQRAMDVVYTGLIRQGRRATDFARPGAPSLRGVDGARCALGWLLQDRWYAEGMEDQRPMHQVNGIGECLKAAISLSGFKGLDWELAETMDRIHHQVDPADWSNRLRRLANSKGMMDPARGFFHLHESRPIGPVLAHPRIRFGRWVMRLLGRGFGEPRSLGKGD